MTKRELFLDNIRSNYAAIKINDRLKLLKDNSSIRGYRSRAREFPAMIKEDLLQTIVFYYSKIGKTGEGYKEFLEDIAGWFSYLKKDEKIDYGLQYDEKDFLSFIMCLQRLDGLKYLLINEELIKLGIWFKMIATAVISVKGQSNE